MKTDLPLRTASVKSAIIPRLYFKYFERLLLRHFTSCTHRHASLDCYVLSGVSEFRQLSLFTRAMVNRVIPFTVSKFSAARAFGIYTTPSDR